MSDYIPRVAPFLPIEDVSEALILRETFGEISLNGRKIELTKAIGGLAFYLSYEGYTEKMSISPAIEAWASEFEDRIPS